jgi:hypothetical protein
MRRKHYHLSTRPYRPGQTSEFWDAGNRILGVQTWTWKADAIRALAACRDALWNAGYVVRGTREFGYRITPPRAAFSLRLSVTGCWADRSGCPLAEESDGKE